MSKLISSLAVIGLGLSMQAFAAHDVDHHENVTMPCYHGGFMIGLTGTYFDTGYARNHYAMVSNQTAATPISGKIKTVGYDYSYGYGIDLGYLFPNTGNDIRMSYYKGDTDDDAVTKKPATGRLFPVITHPDSPYEKQVGIAYGKIAIDHYNVDLELGQSINVGCRAKMRFFAGLSYADLDKNFSAHYRDLNNEVDNVQDGRIKSNFSGFGPVFGIDANYDLGSGFGIVARAASGMYMGELDTSLSIRKKPATTPAIATSISENDTDHFVPSVNFKLGLDYSYSFNSSSTFNLEGGYWGKHYFDAVGSLQYTDSSAKGVYDYQLDDVTFSGYYLTLRAMF